MVPPPLRYPRQDCVQPMQGKISSYFSAATLDGRSGSAIDSRIVVADFAADVLKYLLREFHAPEEITAERIDDFPYALIGHRLGDEIEHGTCHFRGSLRHLVEDVGRHALPSGMMKPGESSLLSRIEPPFSALCKYLFIALTSAGTDAVGHIYLYKF